MAIALYGIPNCDTVKKARKWLDDRSISYAFHDYKKVGADAGKLARWCETAGWEFVLNRRGTTFRALPEADKQALGRDQAIALMMVQPSLIKRPVVEYPGGVLIGFDADAWEDALC